MRLTVGPLPPSVYWRRRALVLGGVVVLIALLAYACGGSDDTNRNGNGAKPGATPSPTLYPSEDVSTEPPSDGGPPASPDDSGDSAGKPPDTGVDSGWGSGTVDGVPSCADDDLKIMPRPAHSQTPEGARLRIDLVINNISDRPCKRDIGADEQEVKIMRDKERIWSSDDCNPQQGSYVEVLLPDMPVERFWITWDGKRSAPKCEGDRGLVQAGSYAVLARLGALISDPVKL